jgi:hypothetical protein
VAETPETPSKTPPNAPPKAERTSRAKAALRKITFRSAVKWIVICAVGLWALFVLMLIGLRWIDPPTTAVHMERRMQAWVHGTAVSRAIQFRSADARSRPFFSTR